jgi:phospholipid/cholesterol/gamma-HCH transport system ATP-binding protein
MRKRAGSARALVTTPRSCSSTSHDGARPILAASIHKLIARTQHTFGFTGVVISHTIPQVFDISDYVAMLADGVIQATKPRTNSSESQNPVCAAVHPWRELKDPYRYCRRIP